MKASTMAIRDTLSKWRQRRAGDRSTARERGG
jgi:hypothetical protein